MAKSELFLTIKKQETINVKEIKTTKWEKVEKNGFMKKIRLCLKLCL